MSSPGNNDRAWIEEIARAKGCGEGPIRQWRRAVYCKMI
jgi:transposase-like protein